MCVRILYLFGMVCVFMSVQVHMCSHACVWLCDSMCPSHHHVPGVLLITKYCCLHIGGVPRAMVEVVNCLRAYVHACMCICVPAV